MKKIAAKLLGHTCQTIIVTPKGSRWGNHLYMLMNAYKHHRKTLVVYSMRPWLGWFDSFESLVIELSKVHRWDIKISRAVFFQTFGQDFDETDLQGFISRYVLSSKTFQNHLQTHPKSNSNDLTINVRRGDFYQDGNSSIYGFDQIGYIKHVLDTRFVNKKISIGTITIISDDMEWCQTHLEFLKVYSPKIIFPEDCFGSPLHCFLRLATSQKLIIPNSTFSYWGAYISNVIYGDNHAGIFAPIFGARNPEYIEAYQLNPKWTIVDDFDF